MELLQLSSPLLLEIDGTDLILKQLHLLLSLDDVLGPHGMVVLQVVTELLHKKKESVLKHKSWTQRERW